MAPPKFFRTAAEFRTWLEAHHESSTELVVGFHRKQPGRPSLLWAESVREALCFGWIDGIVKRLDDERYTRRFTPRKPASIWSNVNIQHALELIAAGRMHPAGLAAFEARKEYRSGIYSFEQPAVALSEPYAGILQSHGAACTYWRAQPPSYQKAVVWWVVSAKQEPTRHRRLQLLIAHSTKGERVPQFTSTPRATSKPKRGGPT